MKEISLISQLICYQGVVVATLFDVQNKILEIIILIKK